MDLIGATVEGKYKVLSVLGAGGAGTVYKAEQEDLSRFVAIKVLHRNNDSSDDRLKLIREAKNLSAGQDSSIIKVLAVGVLEDDSPYLVMEYVEGETLEDFVQRKGALSAAETIKYGLSIARALTVAHASKIIHRDLKPANIMIGEAGGEQFLKILDFGLAKSVSQTSSLAQRNTATGAIVGSIAYMAPEVCAGQQASEKSDIYALGCIMYECLIGHAAFVSDNILALLNMHKEQLPKPLRDIRSELPESLELLVFKCLQKNPTERFQSASDLLSALEAVRDGRSLDSTFDGVRLRDSNSHLSKSKNGTMMPLIVGAAALILISGIGFFATKQRNPTPVVAVDSMQPKPGKRLSGINANTIESRTQKMIQSFESISDGAQSLERRNCEAFLLEADSMIRDTKKPEILFLAWYLKGRTYGKLQDARKSLDAYQKALACGIEAAHGQEPYQAVYAYSGVIHEAEALRDFKTAEHAGVQALKLIEGSEAGKSFPSIQVPVGENSRLLNFFGLAVELEFNFRLARAEFALGKKKEARKHAERALVLAENLERNSIFIRCTLADILASLKEDKLALAQIKTSEKLLGELRRAAQKGPSAMPNVTALFNGTTKKTPDVLLEQYRVIANFYARNGYKADAVRVFQTAIDFAQENGSPQSQIDHMQANVDNLKSSLPN